MNIILIYFFNFIVFLKLFFYKKIYLFFLKGQPYFFVRKILKILN